MLPLLRLRRWNSPHGRRRVSLASAASRPCLALCSRRSLRCARSATCRSGPDMCTAVILTAMGLPSRSSWSAPAVDQHDEARRPEASRHRSGSPRGHPLHRAHLPQVNSEKALLLEALDSLSLVKFRLSDADHWSAPVGWLCLLVLSRVPSSPALSRGTNASGLRRGSGRFGGGGSVSSMGW